MATAVALVRVEDEDSPVALMGTGNANRFWADILRLEGLFLRDATIAQPDLIIPWNRELIFLGKTDDTPIYGHVVGTWL